MRCLYTMLQWTLRRIAGLVRAQAQRAPAGSSAERARRTRLRWQPALRCAPPQLQACTGLCEQRSSHVPASHPSSQAGAPPCQLPCLCKGVSSADREDGAARRTLLPPSAPPDWLASRLAVGARAGSLRPAASDAVAAPRRAWTRRARPRRRRQASRSSTRCSTRAGSSPAATGPGRGWCAPAPAHAQGVRAPSAYGMATSLHKQDVMRLARLRRTALHARACAPSGARSVLMLHRYNKTVDLQGRRSPCTRLLVRWMMGSRMTTPSDAMPCCPSPWPPWRRGCGACRTRWAARRCATKAKSPITCAHRGASIPDIPWLHGAFRALATAHPVAREHARQRWGCRRARRKP